MGLQMTSRRRLVPFERHLFAHLFAQKCQAVILMVLMHAITQFFAVRPVLGHSTRLQMTLRSIVPVSQPAAPNFHAEMTGGTHGSGAHKYPVPRFPPCFGPFFMGLQMTIRKSIVPLSPFATTILRSTMAGGGTHGSGARKYPVLRPAPCVGPFFLWGLNDYQKKYGAREPSCSANLSRRNGRRWNSWFRFYAFPPSLGPLFLWGYK